MAIPTVIYDNCIEIDGSEVFPNSATTVFSILYQSTCAGGEITDGTFTGSTITKIGKDGVDKIIITAIPNKGSKFKGWTRDSIYSLTNTFFGSPTTVSYNATITNNTTWYALFDRDCNVITETFCYNTNKDLLCLDCTGQKTVYFDNIENKFINNGRNINSSTWYGNSTFETLITFSSWSNMFRIGWDFSTSSSESSGGGTFKEKYEAGYDPGCSRWLGRKELTLKCRPSNKTVPYFVFLYKDNSKIGTFERTGDSDISIFNAAGNPSNGAYPVYKLKYIAKSSLTLNATITAKAIWEKSTGGIFCNGGYIDEYGDIYARSTSSGIYTSDGYYTQLINGEYSNYNVIYRIYNGVVVQVLDCKSDVLDCNS